MNSLQTYANVYFSSLNPIAEKISSDIAKTISAYEDLWFSLNLQDQNQILDETIIHPGVVLKYSLFTKDEQQVEVFPRLKIKPGAKYVEEDDGSKGTHVSWRDEHSAPFSWMTRSQLNLSVIEDKEYCEVQSKSGKGNASGKAKTKSISNKKVHISSVDSFIDPPSIVLGGSSKTIIPDSTKLKFPPKFANCNDSLLTKLKSKAAILKIQSIKSGVNKSSFDNNCHNLERQSLVQLKTQPTIVPPKHVKPLNSKHPISKPKTPPPPPPVRPKSVQLQNEISNPECKALLEDNKKEDKEKIDQPVTSKSIESLEDFQVHLSSPITGDSIPKTGFDFLDNW